MYNVLLTRKIVLIVVMCSIQGYLPVVEYLCQASADINKAMNDGRTPLFMAAQQVSI